MGGATPDAYRIGTGQVARDYPADAAPVRLRKQPSLPTVARAPESSLVEQVVSAEDAVVRGKAPGSPRPSRKSRPSKEAATVAQQAAVVRDVVSPQAGRVAQPATPVREYAHRDEAAATYGTDLRPGVPVHRNWHRTTMRVVGAPEDRDGGQRRALVEAASPSEQGGVQSSRVGGASRHQAEARRASQIESRLDRRERTTQRGRAIVIFALGFVSALLIVAAVLGGLFYARSSSVSGLAGAVDSCHAGGVHARLASDGTSLTLEAFSDRGDSLTTPIFQCVLAKLEAPSSVRERMYATRAIDGTRSEEWGSYKATWTYETEQGLTVIVSSR